MSVEAAFALGDIGASLSRAKLVTPDGYPIGDMPSVLTMPGDYDGTIGGFVDRIDQGAREEGFAVVGGSISVAGTLDGEGMLVQSGALTPYLGRFPAQDIEDGLSLPRGSFGILNDVVAIALSQQSINQDNGREVDGTAASWSSGFNVANYYRDGKLEGDEAGHEVLELQGGHEAVCTCDEHNHVNHVEGFVSGNGVKLNNGGVPMEEWIKDPGNARVLAGRMSTALIQLIERHSRTRGGFKAAEMAWTGAVAHKNPFVLQRVARNVRAELGPSNAPAVVAAHMGEAAGLHGTFVDASRRAA